MNEDAILSWLQQLSPIWKAVAGGFASAFVATIRRRPIILWYLYGFVCTLVAWPLVVLPIVHALFVRPRAAAPEQVRQRHRRAEALALLAEGAVRSYPSWIAGLKRKSPTGVNRRRYAYEHMGPGEALELVREHANWGDDHAVGYYHRGVHLGYVPKRHRWVADAIDDGHRLVAIVDKLKIGGLLRRRAKSVSTRITILDANR